MKQIIYDDWIFNIDIERTKKFYSSQKHFYEKPSLIKYPDSLKEFFIQCGIDYEKPCSDCSELSMLYYVYGTAHTIVDFRFELDFFGETRTSSIVIESDQPLKDGSSFTMWLFF